MASFAGDKGDEALKLVTVGLVETIAGDKGSSYIRSNNSKYNKKNRLDRSLLK